MRISLPGSVKVTVMCQACCAPLISQKQPPALSLIDSLEASPHQVWSAGHQRPTSFTSAA